jgi:hypothetical protein
VAPAALETAADAAIEHGAFSEAASVLERVALIPLTGAERAPFLAASGEELHFGGSAGAPTFPGRSGDRRKCACRRGASIPG